MVCVCVVCDVCVCVCVCALTIHDVYFHSELIQKYKQLKQRHEKLYNLFKYQEKQIVDLEQVSQVLMCVQADGGVGARVYNMYVLP